MPVGAAASTALYLSELVDIGSGRSEQIELTPEVDTIVAFGGASVVASTAVDGTTYRRPNGTYLFKAGGVYIYNLRNRAFTHLSVISLGGDSGNLTMRFGAGEV